MAESLQEIEETKQDSQESIDKEENESSQDTENKEEDNKNNNENPDDDNKNNGESGDENPDNPNPEEPEEPDNPDDPDNPDNPDNPDEPENPDDPIPDDGNEEEEIKTTPYTDIYDLFLVIADDYELTELYEVSEDNFLLYLQGYLMLAISDFKRCKKDLSLRDRHMRAFLVELDDKEKSILAKLMAKYWFKKKIQDVTQFQGKLNDKDFKHHSEAQNLTAKRNYYDIIREEVDQDINDYGYDNADWL